MPGLYRRAVFEVGAGVRLGVIRLLEVRGQDLREDQQALVVPGEPERRIEAGRFRRGPGPKCCVFSE